MTGRGGDPGAGPRLRRGQVWPVSLALRETLATAHGPLRSRDGFVLCLESDAGHRGWGDCLPLEGFGLETTPAAHRALRTGLDALLRAPVESLDAALDRVERALPEAPAARAALDLALHDVYARSEGVRIAEQLARSPQHDVAVAALLGGTDRRAVADSAREALAAGFGTLKLKVGARPLAEDLPRVEALRDAAPEARLRLDANGAWTEPEAEAALGALARFDPELVEQPIGGAPEAFQRLRRSSGVALAADESIRDAHSADTFLAAQAVDAIVVKPAAVGGLRAALRIAERAQARGVPVIVTSFLDSSLGIGGALELARALPGDRHAHGLTTDSWLRQDLGRLPPPLEGRRAGGPEPGLGITPSDAGLREVATGAAEVFDA